MQATLHLPWYVATRRHLFPWHLPSFNPPTPSPWSLHISSVTCSRESCIPRSYLHASPPREKDLKPPATHPCSPAHRDLRTLPRSWQGRVAKCLCECFMWASRTATATARTTPLFQTANTYFPVSEGAFAYRYYSRPISTSSTTYPTSRCKVVIHDRRSLGSQYHCRQFSSAPARFRRYIPPILARRTAAAASTMPPPRTLLLCFIHGFKVSLEFLDLSVWLFCC